MPQQNEMTGSLAREDPQPTNQNLQSVKFELTGTNAKRTNAGASGSKMRVSSRGQSGAITGGMDSLNFDLTNTMK